MQASPAGCFAPHTATTGHVRFPLLHIPVPVFVLLFRPELLVLAVMLNISPLAAFWEYAFNIIDAIYV